MFKLVMKSIFRHKRCSNWWLTTGNDEKTIKHN